jgi:hippurate hydrolase
MKSAVLSITTMQAGNATNVISRTAQLTGTVRTLDEEVRDMMEERIKEFVPQLAKSFGASASVTYKRGYPVTVNAERQTDFAADVAAKIASEDPVDRNVSPTMGGEDFAYMLQSRPGAYILLGQGDSAGLHEDTYDFNDEVIPIGCSYWATLVETALPAT